MYTSERLSMLERESDEQNLMEMKTLIFLTIDLYLNNSKLFLVD